MMTNFTNFFVRQRLCGARFTRRHHTSGGGGGGSGGVILVDSGPTTGQPSDTRRHIVLFYGGYAAGVPQGELGDPLRKIEKIMTCEKISMRPYAHTHTCRWTNAKKKHTKNKTKTYDAI
jgi:hypothetical protein